MSWWRPLPAGRAALLLALPVLLPSTACTRPVEGVPAAAPASASPASHEQLERLIVTEVPSGLPRLSDDDLTPPAGAKRVEDIAGYARDPTRERAVLEDYGYRHGWERFWGTETGPVTGVFVDRFDTRAGAGPTPRTSPATTRSATAACCRRTRPVCRAAAGC